MSRGRTNRILAEARPAAGDESYSGSLLSRQVGEACDRWLIARGVKAQCPCGNAVPYGYGTCLACRKRAAAEEAQEQQP